MYIVYRELTLLFSRLLLFFISLLASRVFLWQPFPVTAFKAVSLMSPRGVLHEWHNCFVLAEAAAKVVPLLWS